MSNYSTYKDTEPLTNQTVGEQYWIPVSVNTSTTSVIDNSYVFQGLVYSQAEYPELFNLVGHTGTGAVGSVTSIGIQNISGMVYGNNIYVAVGTNGFVATSTNATTWTVRTSGTTSTINAVVFGNGLFVYAGNTGALSTSTDGITWTARNAQNTNTINGLAYGNNTYIYASQGDRLGYSSNGTSWTSVALGGGTIWISAAYIDGLFVAGGNSGQIVTSTNNGITWTTQGPSNSNNWTAQTLCTDNGIIVTGGSSGFISTSSNYGKSWISRTSGTSSAIMSIIFANGIYVYGTQGGALATSTDAITWTLRNSGTSSNINTLVYTNSDGRYIAGGNSGLVFSSPNLYSPFQSGTTYTFSTHFLAPTITTNNTLTSSGISFFSADLHCYVRAR